LSSAMPVPGAFAIVQDQGRTERREMRLRPVTDLILAAAIGISLAVNGILLRDILRPGEPEHERAQSPRARCRQRVGTRTGHVKLWMRILHRAGMDRTLGYLDIFAVVLDLTVLQDLGDQVHALVDHRLQLG